MPLSHLNNPLCNSTNYDSLTQQHKESYRFRHIYAIRRHHVSAGMLVYNVLASRSVYRFVGKKSGACLIPRSLRRTNVMVSVGHTDTDVTELTFRQPQLRDRG